MPLVQEAHNIAVNIVCIQNWPHLTIILVWFDSPSTKTPTLFFSFLHLALYSLSPLLSPSFLFFSPHFSPSLPLSFFLSISLALPVAPALPLLSLPHLWEAAVVRMSPMSQFVEAVHAHTHTHTHISCLPRRHLFQSVSLWDAAPTERGGDKKREGERREEKRIRKKRCENRGTEQKERRKRRRAQIKKKIRVNKDKAKTKYKTLLQKRRGCCCSWASMPDFWGVLSSDMTDMQHPCIWASLVRACVCEREKVRVNVCVKPWRVLSRGSMRWNSNLLPSLTRWGTEATSLNGMR